MSVKTRIAELNARLAEKLTAKGVEADGSETTTALIDKVDDIPQGGGDSGLDLFKYIYSPPTISTDIAEITEDIVLHMERTQSVSNMCSGISWGCEKVTLYISEKCTSFFRAFRFGGGTCKLKEFEIIGDTSNVTTFAAAFHNKASLERITGELDFSSTTTTTEMVGLCTKLKEFRIVPNTLSVSFSVSQSPDLTAATIQSIIDGLADLTGETAQTLTLHADVKAKLTETQIATITNKNWTLA